MSQTALVTGASRGIGAAVAENLAHNGIDVVINYRSKERRARAVAEIVQAAGQRALLAQADLTNPAEMQAMYEEIFRQFGKLDYLILNASGGLESGKSPDYAMDLNFSAQMIAVIQAMPLMVQGGRVTFVTSHLAHFYGNIPVYTAYEPVAASKKAGEDALREYIQKQSASDVSLVVVSGDMIEGTITPKLLDRQNPGIIEARRQQVKELPSVEEFATAIVDATLNSELESDSTIFVGDI